MKLKGFSSANLNGAPSMKAKAIMNFAVQFGVKIALNPDLMVEKNGRYYLVNPVLKPLVKAGFLLCRSFFGKS